LCSKEKEIQEIHQAVLGTGHDDGILQHTKKTNGRVTKLETWRNYIIGGTIVLGTVFGLLVYLGSYWLSAEIKSSVYAGVSKYTVGAEFEKQVVTIIEKYEEKTEK